jgi:hypothetical protein
VSSFVANLRREFGDGCLQRNNPLKNTDVLCQAKFSSRAGCNRAARQFEGTLIDNVMSTPS